VLWFASFLCIYFSLFFSAGVSVFSFSKVFLLPIVSLYVHSYASTVQFSTTSTPNKCLFFCMCAFDGHMRRYNKPTLRLEINGFEWQNVSLSLSLSLSLFLHKGQINLRYICLQKKKKKNCTWRQPSRKVFAIAIA
jgi:hypothetical protein